MGPYRRCAGRSGHCRCRLFLPQARAALFPLPASPPEIYAEEPAAVPQKKEVDTAVGDDEETKAENNDGTGEQANITVLRRAFSSFHT